jgi:hypothetical protein
MGPRAIRAVVVVWLRKLTAHRLNGEMAKWLNVSIPWANFWRVPGIGFSELDSKRGGRPFVEEKFCHV